MNGSSVTCVGLVCGLPNFYVALRILFTFDIHIHLLFAANVVELASGYYLKAGRACGVGCMLLLVRFMFNLNCQSISFFILQSVRVDHCERVQLIAAAKRISISNAVNVCFSWGLINDQFSWGITICCRWELWWLSFCLCALTLLSCNTVLFLVLL